MLSYTIWGREDIQFNFHAKLYNCEENNLHIHMW